MLNAFSDGIFVRLCPGFAEKCRISVVKKSLENGLFLWLYGLCYIVFFRYKANKIVFS